MIVSQKALHKEQSTHMVLLLCWYYSLSNHMVTQDKDTNYKNWFLLNAPSNQTLPRPLTTLFQQITEKKVSQLRLSSLLRRHSALGKHSVTHNPQVKKVQVNPLKMLPDSNEWGHSGTHHEIHHSLSHSFTIQNRDGIQL